MKILCLGMEVFEEQVHSGLEDAEEEHAGEDQIPLGSHFLEIKGILEAKDINALTGTAERGAMGANSSSSSSSSTSLVSVIKRTFTPDDRIEWISFRKQKKRKF